MILLDSNVLIYATGSAHPMRDAAVALLGCAHEGHMRVTPRVLEEFAHVYARRGRPRPGAVELVGEWSAALGPVEHASEEDLAVGFDLWASHDRLDLADAVLSAIALRHGAQLVSADAAFADVVGLRFVHLADPGLLGRIAN